MLKSHTFIGLDEYYGGLRYEFLASVLTEDVALYGYLN